MYYNHKKWLKAAGIRAVKTFAQTALSFVTVGTIISAIDWGVAFSTATVAAVYSILTSLAGIPEVHIEEPKKKEG